MSALDKFYDFTLNLPDAKLTSKTMSLCNIDRNVFNIYLTLQEGKNNPILNADLSNYTVTMIVVKPKTKEYVEKVGVIDGSNDRLLFELGETFNDQIGSYKGEIKVQNGDEVITSSSFAYTVTQSLISGLNAEIEANPDVEILRQLINEVKAAVGMTPEDPDSLLTDYQKKTDETLTTTDKTIVGAINELKTNSENIKGHTHANKIALDKITDEKITSWDSKAEGSHNHDAVYAKKSEIPVVDVTKQYVDTELGKKSPIHEHPYLPNTTKIPTKVSELTNDSKFTTEAYVKNEIANAQLGGQGGVDLSGYATKEDLKAKADKSELNNKVDKEVGKGLSTNDFTTAEKEKLEGLNNYTLPIASATVLGGVKVGAGLSVSNGVLSATGGGTADSVDWGNIQNKPSVFTPDTHVHSYNDLTNKPTIPTVDVTKKYVDDELLKKSPVHEHPYKPNSYMPDWDEIQNKPSTFTPATHNHSYNDLTEKPNIPSIVGLAKETYVDAKVAEIVDSAPETLNTLNELSTALGNDPNFATTVANQIGTKASTEYVNAELGKKVNTEGYVATENSYTTVEKTKLQGIQEGANNYTHPAKHKPSDITQDNLHRFITDAERQTWNNKSDFDGNYNKLTNKPTIPTVSNDLTNTLKANYDSAYTHSQSAHAPTNAQKNSDITLLEIEAKLKGNITTHTHNQYLTQHQSLIDYAKKTEIPNRMSQLQNDASYAKESSIDTKISARLGDIKIKKLTKQEYDSIGSKDPNCLYIIIKTM